MMIVSIRINISDDSADYLRECFENGDQNIMAPDEANEVELVDPDGTDVELCTLYPSQLAPVVLELGNR